MKQAQTAPKVGFVSLGCAKALVDSERILTQLRAEGYEFSGGYQDADLVVVNTCGFLDSAREESLSAIGEALSENGKVLVTGCMGATPELIHNKYPDVLSITGPAQYESLLEAVHKALPRKHEPHMDLVPAAGVKLTPRHYAYLKISEGCNNRCSFCIIPQLRGDLVSRPVGDVLQEAERLVQSGVKELLVVSQDTSAYGMDIKYAKSDWRGKEVRAKFYDLCEHLGELGAWVRLHYVYPYPHVDEAVRLMADGKILPYLDIPFQHASPRVLKAMRRPANHEKILERIAKWRDECPDITLRSTFIVGFPGETEEEFQFLLDWLEEAQLDRVGCFRYENVSDAPSNNIAGHIAEEVKQERWERLMSLQQKISADRLTKKIGRTLQVLVDEVSEESPRSSSEAVACYTASRSSSEAVARYTAVGRSCADAPEVDGVVHIKTSGRVLAGSIVPVKIEASDAYDLYGNMVQMRS